MRRTFVQFFNDNLLLLDVIISDTHAYIKIKIDIKIQLLNAVLVKLG